MEPQLFVAMKAFVVHDGKVLIIRESPRYGDGVNIGRFDVVGGRVKPGERFDESLLREIKEEAGLDVTIGRPFYVSEWRPVVSGKPWQIIGMYIECAASSSDVTLGQDHDAFEWIDPKEHRHFPLIENLGSAFEAYLLK